MTINFPWGSLLRGVLGHDEAALAGVGTLLAPGARGGAGAARAPRGRLRARRPRARRGPAGDRRGDRRVRLVVGEEAPCRPGEKTSGAVRDQSLPQLKE